MKFNEDFIHFSAVTFKNSSYINHKLYLKIFHTPSPSLKIKIEVAHKFSQPFFMSQIKLHSQTHRQKNAIYNKANFIFAQLGK